VWAAHEPMPGRSRVIRFSGPLLALRADLERVGGASPGDNVLADRATKSCHDSARAASAALV
jgi:hypothetical protein